MTTYDEIMSGGIEVGGNATQTVDLFYFPDGGPVYTSGSAYTLNNNQYYPDGGPVFAYGTAETNEIVF